MEGNYVQVPYDDFCALIEHDTKYWMLRDAHCGKKYGIPNDIADAVFGFEHGCEFKEENKNAE